MEMEKFVAVIRSFSCCLFTKQSRFTGNAVAIALATSL